MQTTCCSTASLGSLASQAPAPITLFHFHFHPSSPNLPTKGRTRPERDCSECPVPSQLSQEIIKPQSTHRDGSGPKTGEKEGSDCRQKKGTLLRTIFLVFTNTFPPSNVQFSRRKTPCVQTAIVWQVQVSAGRWMNHIWINQTPSVQTKTHTHAHISLVTQTWDSKTSL